jgi:hypothetical protein
LLKFGFPRHTLKVLDLNLDGLWICAPLPDFTSRPGLWYGGSGVAKPRPFRRFTRRAKGSEYDLVLLDRENEDQNKTSYHAGEYVPGGVHNNDRQGPVG